MKYATIRAFAEAMAAQGIRTAGEFMAAYPGKVVRECGK